MYEIKATIPNHIMNDWKEKKEEEKKKRKTFKIECISDITNGIKVMMMMRSVLKEKKFISNMQKMYSVLSISFLKCTIVVGCFSAFYFFIIRRPNRIKTVLPSSNVQMAYCIPMFEWKCRVFISFFRSRLDFFALNIVECSSSCVFLSVTCADCQRIPEKNEQKIT